MGEREYVDRRLSLPPGVEAPPRGLGDVVEKLARPVAKALGMDCHDKETGELKPGTPCARRRATLNRRFPFKRKKEG